MALTLYDLPHCYDLAFGWDVTAEADLMEAAIADHGRPGSRLLLEPACGTGRLLPALAWRGYQLVGYDHNRAMVEHARQRMKAEGATDQVAIRQADMIDARFDESFDAAFCPINSLAHMLTDDAISRHLQVTAQSLQPGGVYLVQLTSFHEPDTNHLPYTYSAEDGELALSIRWTVESEDPNARLAVNRCQLAITENGQTRHRDELVELRLWLHDDWQRLVEASPFDQVDARGDEEFPWMVLKRA